MYRESIILETICTVYLLWNNLNYMLEILRYRAHYRLLILIFNAGIKNIHLSLYERSISQLWGDEYCINLHFISISPLRC